MPIAARRTPRLLLADDAASGLAMARRHAPDIVLIDMNLPDANGLDVLHALHDEPDLRGRLCVALSADAMPEQVRLALAAGFDDYWTKPINVRELRRKLLGHEEVGRVVGREPVTIGNRDDRPGVHRVPLDRQARIGV